jgi:hypothetical protein
MWHRAYLASNGFFAERLRLNFSPEEFLTNRSRCPSTLRAMEDRVGPRAVDNEIRLLKHEVSLLEDQRWP